MPLKSTLIREYFWTFTKMKFVILGVISAFVTSAYSKEFNPKMESSSSRDESVTNQYVERLNEFSGQMREFVVLIMEDKNARGTGLIVSSSFLMTALSVVKEYDSKNLTIKSHTICDEVIREIVSCSTMYAPVSTARFAPEVELRFSMAPTYITNHDTIIDDRVISIGFDGEQKPSWRTCMIQQFDKNKVNVNCLKRGTGYKARFGDVLVNDGKVLGYLVRRYKRKEKPYSEQIYENPAYFNSVSF